MTCLSVQIPGMARRELWGASAENGGQQQLVQPASDRQEWTRDLIDRATRRAELRAEVPPTQRANSNLPGSSAWVHCHRSCA